MRIHEIFTKINIYNFMSFLASSGISTIKYINQSNPDYRLMIITSTISVIIISISIFLIHNMKLQHKKLQDEKQKISDELDLITNSNRSMQPCEPTYETTPRQDTFINQLLTYLNLNSINQIYFNKSLNRIELNMV